MKNRTNKRKEGATQKKPCMAPLPEKKLKNRRAKAKSVLLFGNICFKKKIKDIKRKTLPTKKEAKKTCRPVVLKMSPILPKRRLYPR